MDVFSADWTGICRRIVAAQRRIFDEVVTSEERTVYQGIGEGGDHTLVIDRRCEDEVFAELEQLGSEGASFVAVSEERGEVSFGDGGPVRVVIDPIDGSLNARRTLPSHSLSSRSPRATRWPTCATASSTTSAPTRSSSRPSARVPRWTAARRGSLGRRAPGGRRTRVGGARLDDPGAQIAGGQRLPPARGRLDRDHRLLRRGGPLRRLLRPAPLPLGRRRRRPAVRPRGGRRGGLRRRRAVRRAARPRRPLPMAAGRDDEALAAVSPRTPQA